MSSLVDRLGDFYDRTRREVARGALHRRLRRLGRFVAVSGRKVRADGVLLTASALAYTTLVSLIPLLAAFSFVGTRIFEEYREETVRLLVEILPYHQENVTEQISGFLRQAEQLQGWATVAFFATALFAFGTVDMTVNDIWRVHRRRPFRVRFLSFTLLIFWGPVLIGAVFSSLLALRRVPWVGAFLETSLLFKFLPFAATLLGLTMLYWLVPYTWVGFRHAMVGGATAAVLLELVRAGFGLYVGLLDQANAIYGGFAFIFFFALSIQVSWTIILYGSVVAYCSQNFRALEKIHNRTAPVQARWVGLAAVAVLARRLLDGEPVTGEEELAEHLVMPSDQLVEHLRPLVEGEVLKVLDGRETGYLLALPPSRIEICQILEAYEDSDRPVFEPLGREVGDALADLLDRIRGVRREELGEMTVGELLDGVAGTKPDTG